MVATATNTQDFATYAKEVQAGRVHFDQPKQWTVSTASHDIANDEGRGYIEHTLGSSRFGTFADEAYKSEKGYAIRVNPETGEKEMFIAGTRHNSQWALNALDGILYGGDEIIKRGGNLLLEDAKEGFFTAIGQPEMGLVLPAPHIKGIHMLEHADPWRLSKEKYFSKIARDNGVTVIYGHSRGAALAADMDVPGATKIGLDGATVLAHDTGILNISEAGGGHLTDMFDAGLALRGHNTVYMDTNVPDFHKVYAAP